MRKLFGRQNIPRKPPAQAATIAAKQTASFAFEQPNEDNEWQDLTQPQQQGQQQIVRELRAGGLGLSSGFCIICTFCCRVVEIQPWSSVKPGAQIYDKVCCVTALL